MADDKKNFDDKDEHEHQNNEDSNQEEDHSDRLDTNFEKLNYIEDWVKKINGPYERLAKQIDDMNKILAPWNSIINHRNSFFGTQIGFQIDSGITKNLQSLSSVISSPTFNDIASVSKSFTSVSQQFQDVYRNIYGVLTPELTDYLSKWQYSLDALHGISMNDPMPEPIVSKILELSEEFEVEWPLTDSEGEEIHTSEANAKQQSTVSWKFGLQLIFNVITLFVALLSIQQSNSGTEQLIEESRRNEEAEQKRHEEIMEALHDQNELREKEIDLQKAFYFQALKKVDELFEAIDFNKDFEREEDHR